MMGPLPYTVFTGFLTRFCWLLILLYLGLRRVFYLVPVLLLFYLVAAGGGGLLMRQSPMPGGCFSSRLPAATATLPVESFKLYFVIEFIVRVELFFSLVSLFFFRREWIVYLFCLCGWSTFCFLSKGRSLRTVPAFPPPRSPVWFCGFA